ncbi:hypothetical protein ID866_2515 [Astraeus odoratus]|nr:hypothetical protein ID866_2515 [Astraeus odoratus]
MSLVAPDIAEGHTTESAAGANPTVPKRSSRNSVQIALRAYILAVSFTLGPALIPVAHTLVTDQQNLRKRVDSLRAALSRELGWRGFPFAVAVAISVGQSLRRIWELPETKLGPPGPTEAECAHLEGDPRSPDTPSHTSNLRFAPYQTTFLANALSSIIALGILQRRHQHYVSLSKRQRSHTSSPTIDLSLWVLVHALDALVQSKLLSCRVTHNMILSRRQSVTGDPCPEGSSSSNGDTLQGALSKNTTKRNFTEISSLLDSVVFWACSGRSGHTSQPEYLALTSLFSKELCGASFMNHIGNSPILIFWNRINKLARIDRRLPDLLRAIREGTWSYGYGSPYHQTTASTLASDLGYPASWGNPDLLPAYGGEVANVAWKKLGLMSASCSILFILSAAMLLTTATHQPDSLRGLARWTLTFIMKGPDIGLRFKRNEDDTGCLPRDIRHMPSSAVTDD